MCVLCTGVGHLQRCILGAKAMKRNMKLKQAELTEDALSARQKPTTDHTDDNNLRQWRIFKGFKSHGDLAAKTVEIDPDHQGVNRVSILRLENGKLRYNQRQIDLLAQALGIDPHELLHVNPNDLGSFYAWHARMNAKQKRAFEAAALVLAKKIASD